MAGKSPSWWIPTVSNLSNTLPKAQQMQHSEISRMDSSKREFKVWTGSVYWEKKNTGRGESAESGVKGDAEEEGKHQ